MPLGRLQLSASMRGVQDRGSRRQAERLGEIAGEPAGQRDPLGGDFRFAAAADGERLVRRVELDADLVMRVVAAAAA